MATLASSSSPYPSPVRDNDPGSTQRPKQPSALYSTIMTPINLTVFLLSLLIVDLRYSLARTDDASGRAVDATGSGPLGPLRWLPPRLTRWFGRLVSSFRPQPYHSKQRKLLKMEADEAFQLQGLVLLILSMLAVLAAAIFFCVASRAYYGFRHLVLPSI